MSKITPEFLEGALRRGIVAHPKAKSPAPQKLVLAAALEMANYGFLVRPQDLYGLSTPALQNMLRAARTIMGADRNMTPIYPGFPKQVKELDTLTLLMEQLLHYWTAGAYLPQHPQEVRPGLPIEDMVRRAREVQVMPAARAVRELQRELTLDKIALSKTDDLLLQESVQVYTPKLQKLTELVAEASNGENMQALLYAVRKTSTYSPTEIFEAVLPSVQGADHLLRVALALYASPNDAPQQRSLVYYVPFSSMEDNYERAVRHLSDKHAGTMRFERMARPVRRALVQRLAEYSTGYDMDYILKHQQAWRRVMRAAHPYDLKLTSEQRRMLDILHENVEYRTLASLVEEKLDQGRVIEALKLMDEERPHMLLPRLVELLRRVSSQAEARVLAGLVFKHAKAVTLTKVISAYNGVLSANMEKERLVRVAGARNKLVAPASPVPETYLREVRDALTAVMVDKLAQWPAPQGAVGVLDASPVPLVRRDAASADRTLERGQELTVAGEGDTLRLFGHWNNTFSSPGYMDIGAVLLDDKCSALDVITWNTWCNNRTWATYSGDKYVYPGDSAAEFIDVDLSAVRQRHPEARWVMMTVQSWSGWPIKEVDLLAGAMLRGKAEEGEVFDARTVETAFKSLVESTQSAPLAVELSTGKMVWMDTSSGSMRAGVSSSDDESLSALAYDSLLRPRLTMGDLAKLWAKAHAVVTCKTAPVEREQLLELLHSH